MKKRTYKYQYHNMIVDTCEEIFLAAFKDDEIAEAIEYDPTWMPALDAHILNVHARFETDEMEVDLSFTLDTGTGGLFLNKDPEYYCVELEKTLIDNEGVETACYRWDTECKRWRRYLTMDENGILNNLSVELKRDTGRLLSFLKKQELGCCSSTSKLAEQVLRKTNYSEEYLNELDRALCLKCVENGLFLDKLNCVNIAFAGTNSFDLEFVLKEA